MPAQDPADFRTDGRVAVSGLSPLALPLRALTLRYLCVNLCVSRLAYASGASAPPSSWPCTSRRASRKAFPLVPLAQAKPFVDSAGPRTDAT